MRRVSVLFAALALTWLGLVVDAGPSTAQPASAPLACGDTITVDTTLHADLLDCPSNGLVIGADDITLDLNGHTIDGDGVLVDPCEAESCDLGVDNGAGYTGVAVRNGTVKEFGFGIVVGGATNNVASRLRLTDNAFSGYVVFDSSHVSLVRSLVARNGLDTDFSGIGAFGTTDSLIAHNRIVANGDIGIYAETIDRNRVVGNRFADHPEAGMLFDGTGNVIGGNTFVRNADGVGLAGDHNVITGNRITRALGCEDGCGNGISIEGGSGNVAVRNVVSRSIVGIRVDAFTGLAENTVVRHNVVLGSSRDNIAINPENVGPVENTLIGGNLVARAGDDGIDVRSASTTIAHNLAVRNHDLGIQAVRGVTDGGGNHAAHNGDPRQCTNVSC